MMLNENEMARFVRKAIEGYFKDLDGEKARGVYDMVINSVDLHNEVEWLPEWLDDRGLGTEYERARELREALRSLVLANNRARPFRTTNGSANTTRAGPARTPSRGNSKPRAEVDS